MNAECIGQQAVTQVHAGLNPVMHHAVIWSIEDVVCHHFEGGKVTAGTPYCVDVSEPNAGLRNGQWVGRWVGQSACHVWLEIGD